MKRRAFLGAGGLGFAGSMLLGAGALTSCSGRSDRLRAGWWGDPALNDAVRQAVDAFEGRSGAAVSSEFMPWDGYWDKLATQTAGESEPDLMMQAATYLPAYVTRHTLLDLDPYVGNTIRLDRIDPGVREVGRYQGSTYAAIAAINATTVIYNADLVRTARVEPPDRMWTWSDLEGFAARVQAYDHQVYGMEDAGGDLILFHIWVRQRGRELFDTRDRLAISRADLAEWLAYWDDLRRSGRVPSASVTAEGGGDLARSPMVRRRAAAKIGFSQDLGALSDLLEDDLRLALPPRARSGGPSGLWLNAASLWAGSGHTHRPDQVAALVDFLVNSKPAAEALGVRLGVPPQRAVRDRLREQVDEADRQALDYIDLVGADSSPLPRLWPQGFTELRDLLPRLNEDIGFGERSIDDAVERFFAETERVLV